MNSVMYMTSLDHTSTLFKEANDKLYADTVYIEEGQTTNYGEESINDFI